MLSPKEELTNVIEGILFVSGQGVSVQDIAEKLEIDVKKINKAIEELKEKYKERGINVITYKNNVQLCSNPIYADDIATVLNPIREKQLTKAALETLAIIAYKQPLTKLDIEEVRGVNSDYAVQVLLNFNLIEVIGRKDAIGKPLLYATTNEFLKRFDLQDINDLPDYDELLERIEILHKEYNEGLYRSTEIIPEEELEDSVNKTKDNEQILEVHQEELPNEQAAEEEIKSTLMKAYNTEEDDSALFEDKDNDLL